MEAAVQQPPAVKAAVNIADVGRIAQMPDQKEQFISIPERWGIVYSICI